MAYRSNAVTISAADGLGIVSGTFVIKDLSITNGQDPDGRNYVGQVHTLENGEFTFSVGRSASESVASWFNSKISGYNDPSVNGDRTTFDQTADDLNFAFVGDLNLVVDTADDPQGLSVTLDRPYQISYPASSQCDEDDHNIPAGKLCEGREGVSPNSIKIHANTNGTLYSISAAFPTFAKGRYNKFSFLSGSAAASRTLLPPVPISIPITAPRTASNASSLTAAGVIFRVAF